MLLGRDEIAAIVKQALQEIGMTVNDAELETLTIALVLQQLKDAGGSTWNPSPTAFAGLIMMLLREKGNHPRAFTTKWFSDNDNNTATCGTLIDYLNVQQTDVG